MAAVDPIHFQSVFKIFPGLTLNQATDMCLYSTGATYKDVGELRGVSPETIKKSLEVTRGKLNLQNIQSTSTVFWGRLVVLLSSGGNHENHDGQMLTLSKGQSDFNHLQASFPELSPETLNAACHFTAGKTVSEISTLMNTTEDTIESYLANSLILLNVTKLQSLRFVVMARLLENLTLDKLHSFKW